MLDKNEIEELIKIVAAATTYMDAERNIPDYSLLAIQWNDEICRWEVVFYSDYGIDYTTILVCQNKAGRYTATGHAAGSDWEIGSH